MQTSKHTHRQASTQTDKQAHKLTQAQARTERDKGQPQTLALIGLEDKPFISSAGSNLERSNR